MSEEISSEILGKGIREQMLGLFGIDDLDKFREQWQENVTKYQDEAASRERHGIKLTLTCTACPEQYDALYEGKVVGYLRLRHGSFTVHSCTPTEVSHLGRSAPVVVNEIDFDATLYEGNPVGDGVFENDEREGYLNIASLAIRLHVEPGYRPEDHDG